MTLKELKTMARWGIVKWCDKVLPKDGDYIDPEIRTDRISGRSPGTPNDGDYVVMFIFHNSNEGEKKK